MTRQVLAGISATLVLGGGGVFAADEQIDPYTDKQTHYELPIVSDIPQGERVEIHKDKAQMDLIGWNDEYKISIIPQIPTAQLGAVDKPFTVPADRPLLSKRMEYKSGDVTAFIEPKEGTENEFDIDFTLDSKPDTNVFEYKIEGAEEFDFFYQPELTVEEIDEGTSRPENVEGSYAVYHKTKANHRIGSTNYAVGKVFHIYRPKAIDANGAEAWAELSYVAGTLSVIVPLKFLDDADYPVLVDPTFGVTTQGGSSGVSGANAVRGQRDTPVSSGTVDMITAYNRTSSGTADIKGMVIASSTLAILTNGVGGAVTVDTTPAWRDSTFASPPSITGSTPYIAAYIGDATGPLVYFDAVTADGQNQRDLTNSYATPADPTDMEVNRTTKHSIYATYTADAPPATSFPQNSPLIF